MSVYCYHCWVILILSSSVVERSAVNRLVVGSNPTWGVLIFKFIDLYPDLC